MAVVAAAVVAAVAAAVVAAAVVAVVVLFSLFVRWTCSTSIFLSLGFTA